MAVTAPDRGRCLAAIDTLLRGCEGAQAAMLALRDGRPFVERLAAGIDSGRFAAMTSSLGALGQSVLRELRGGHIDHLLVEGSEGKLVICTVPETGGLLLLAVLASHEARLGLVLGQAKLCAQSVAAAIPAAAGKPA